MAFLGKFKKEDLIVLAEDLGLKVSPGCQVSDLVQGIITSPDYQEDFCMEFLAGVEVRRQEEEEREIKLRQARRNRTISIGNGLVGHSEGLEGASLLKCVNMMEGKIAKLPNRVGKWPSFFQQAEQIFQRYRVPQEYWGRIILLQLKGKSKGLFHSLGGDMGKYELIKEIMLQEINFKNMHSDQADESLFNSKNKNTLNEKQGKHIGVHSDEGGIESGYHDQQGSIEIEETVGSVFEAKGDKDLGEDKAISVEGMDENVLLPKQKENANGEWLRRLVAGAKNSSRVLEKYDSYV